MGMACQRQWARHIGGQWAGGENDGVTVRQVNLSLKEAMERDFVPDNWVRLEF